MILYVSGEIFQAKLDRFLGDIKGFKTYIKNLIVLGKYSFYSNIYQLRVIFAMLINAGSKSDAPK